MYKIHYDGDPKALAKNCRHPNICWSLYVKKHKGRTEAIWKFHRFAHETLIELYPLLGDDDKSEVII